MKKMILFVCMFIFASFLSLAAAESAFKPCIKKTSRLEELNKCVASLESSLALYRNTMKPFADERRELAKFGIEVTASFDPKSAQAKLKSERDKFAAHKRKLLCVILSKDLEESWDQSESELVQELIRRPLTPESEPSVEIFWKIDEAVKTEEKTYKIPSVFPKPESNSCSIQ